MTPLMLAAALSLSSMGWSGDVGERVLFRGRSLVPLIAAGAGVNAGDVLWISPSSDKLKNDFEKLFFQGIVQNQDIRFQACVGDAKAWGPWVDADLEVSANGRFWAKIMASGKPGDRVKFRALSRSGFVAQAQLFGIEAVDDEPEEPGGSGHAARLLSDSADAGVVAPAPQKAPPQEPAVLSRKAWHAAKAKKPYEPMVPDRITVHHTEAFQAFTEDDAAQEMRVIQSFHQSGRGWIDIGYHFLIDGSGRIWEGRPVGVVGAHVKDKNDGNVGISLMGNFHAPQNDRPSIAQVQSLVDLLDWLTAKYAIPAERVKGHRDEGDTSCPGDILYAMLPDIRRRVSTGSVAFRLPSPAQVQIVLGAPQP